MIEILILIYLIVIGINVIYVKSYKTIRNIKYKLEIRKEGNIFYRDIDVKYSPAIVSYLYNQKIEPKKDVIVDIFNLYARKIIDIKNIGQEKFILQLNEQKYMEEKNKNRLFENDIYLIEAIVLNKNIFKYEKWLEKVIKVYREKLKQKKKSRLDTFINASDNKFFLSICILEVIITFMAYIIMKDINALSTGTILTFLVILLFFIIYKILNRDENLDMHLNDEAKEELKKWIRFENFIKEDILIKDKKYEHIVLYEQYIPFAMVLNINKEYKKEMIRILNKSEVNLIFDSINDYEQKNIFNY